MQNVVTDRNYEPNDTQLTTIAEYGMLYLWQNNARFAAYIMVRVAAVPPPREWPMIFSW